MKEKQNVEEMENAKFTLAKGAFKAAALHCDSCNKKMKQVKMEMDMPDGSLTIKLNAFRCANCDKEYLNFEEAKKLDKALLVSRLLKEDNYRIRKSLSFDGDNYIFRIPVGIARSLGKNPYADITPLSSKDLLVHLNRG